MNSDTKSTEELAEHLVRLEFDRLKKERKEDSGDGQPARSGQSGGNQIQRGTD